MNTYFLGLLKVDKERRQYDIFRDTICSSWEKRKGWWISSHHSYSLVTFSIFISKDEDEEVGVTKEGENWNLEHGYYDYGNSAEEPDGESDIYLSKRELNMYLQLEKGFKGKNFLLRVDDSWLPGVVALLS
jgi:hypothetical protein